MAAALVGGSFLSAFLQVLFDRMATPEFLNLFRGREDDDKLLKKLKRNLLVVGAVLDDAENKETTNQTVKEWLEELHDTVGEADDLLDKINTEALRIKIETEYQSPGNQVISSTNTRLSFSSFTTEFLNGMMPRLESIVVSLEGFIQHITPLGLQVGESKRQSNPRQPSTSLVGDVTYGRDSDKEKIVQMLLSGDGNGDSISVVPIVGLGGVGKTTLAQLVYQDERVKEYFPATRAWVCVSEEYDAARITKDLLRKLNVPFSDSGESFDSLQVKLRDALNQKKFLLVLDDVWNRNYNDWDNLRVPFKGGLRGSKIIVTTRDRDVALMMGKEESIHVLDSLSEEDSWSLFKKHAFENKDGNDQNPELEEIGKKIVKKCAGLPLAVKTVAGLLRSKTMPDEWEDVLTSEVWSRTDNLHGILPALRLSYMHLPSYLKRCFAYCAVFPKDYNFEKERVIQLWLANDLLVRPRDNRPTGNTGEECFRELISRSLFQLKNNNCFTMHDLVNDLARSVSGKYCFRLEDYNLQTHGTVARLNHFSYFGSYHDRYDKFKLLEEATDLRTILQSRTNPLRDFHLSSKFLHDMLPKLKSLRALSLSGYHIRYLPDSLSGLKQLRFLELSYTWIQKLPEWICSLYNLQTLLLANCRYLEELPVDLGKLINLSYLDISGTSSLKMQTYIGRSIRNLRLTSLAVGEDSGPMIKELGKFHEIGIMLRLSGLENVSCCRSASMANIKGKKQLKNLTLHWGDNSNDSQVARHVLESLEPPSTIERIEIKGYYGTRFPDWLGSPSFCHMKSLRMDGCKYCFELPALGRLRSLESLEIVGMSKLSALTGEMYGDISETKPFPSLKRFIIKRMEELERWDIPAECEVFCSLKELHIIGCPELVVGQLPLKLICSLEEIEISGCDKLVLPNGRLSIFNGDDPQPSSLRRLEISALKNLKELWPAQNSLPNRLERLTISGCESLLTFTGLESESFQGGSNLKELKLRKCDCLIVPLGLFPTLESVWIDECRSIEMLLSIPPRGIQVGGSSLASLTRLIILDCEYLISFPEGGLPAPNLTVFTIGRCQKLKSLPEQMESLLPSLRHLQIAECPEIECFPKGGLPSTLQSLQIYNCKKLMTRPREWDLRRLTSLKILEINGFGEPLESVPHEDWLLPSTLEYLELGGGDKVKMLNYSGLRDLTSLKKLSIHSCSLLQSLPDKGLPSSITTLKIYHCPLLQSLPDVGLPASLTTLHIENCPLLKPRLEWEKGQEWPKVAHIPCAVLDQEVFP